MNFVDDYFKGKISKDDLPPVYGKKRVDEELIKKVFANIERHGICQIIFNTTSEDEHFNLARDLQRTLEHLDKNFKFIITKDYFTCVVYKKEI